MTAKLLLGLLLTATLAAAAQAQPAEAPCALAKRIAQSPPCLAGSACEAVDLWREAFGAPRIHPAGAEQLPPELASKLPDSEVNLGKLESFEDTFQRLGEASGFEVLLHPALKEEKLTGELGPMPIAKAWNALLSGGGLLTHFDGERLLIARAPSSRPGPLGRQRSLTFNCPVR